MHSRDAIVGALHSSQRREDPMSLKQLFVLVLLLGVVLITNNSLFAQTNVLCGLSTPLGATPNAASTGHAEPIAAGPPIIGPGFEISPPTPGGGVLRVTCTNSGGTGTPGVVALQVALGVPITNSTGHPNTAAGIRIANTTGDFNPLNVGINTVANSGGVVGIGLGTAQPTPTTGIAFTAGATLPLANFKLLAADRSRKALHQLAARPPGKLSGASGFPRIDQ